MPSDLTFYIFPKATYAIGGGHPAYFDELNATGEELPQNDPDIFAKEVTLLTKNLGLSSSFHWYEIPWADDIKIPSIMAVVTLNEEQKRHLPILKKHFSVRQPQP